jgi:chitinase
MLSASGASSSAADGSSGPIGVRNASFPAPFAGAFYPIYKSGAGQWIEPKSSMPFEKVSALFIAFGHAYRQANGAVFDYERGQPDQPARLLQLAQVARQKNPLIKIFISLGWGQHDWDYIAADYANHANLFVPTVIQFLRINALDGFDIDDEAIGPHRSSGDISQTQFDGVIANLRKALDTASAEDHKPYYLSITPAGDNQPTGLYGTQVESENAKMFDLISIQYYYLLPSWGMLFLDGLKSIHFPLKQIGIGINTDTTKCNPYFPDETDLAGYFDWNMTADSTCDNFKYTKEIARRVGY